MIPTFNMSEKLNVLFFGHIIITSIHYVSIKRIDRAISSIDVTNLNSITYKLTISFVVIFK